MKAGIYLGKEKIVLQELPLPEVGDNDVLIQNLYSSICGTDVAVFTHGPNTGHKVTVGGEFGHETVSRVVKVGKNIKDFTVGCRAARRGMIPCGNNKCVAGQNAVVFGCGTIGIAAAVAFQYFGMSKVMLCDCSDFRLKLAKELGFAVCNPSTENFAGKAKDYFGMAHSLSGETADIDCWLDAAGAESILNDFLHMTYAQQSIMGSGGYMLEDVADVQKMMSCGKWDLEHIITHEFPLEQLETAIRTASDVNRSGNVVVKMAK